MLICVFPSLKVGELDGDGRDFGKTRVFLACNKKHYSDYLMSDALDSGNVE
jgi:hypothetical protein